MFSLIVAEYNSIKKTLNFLETFCSNSKSEPHMIIVDNSPNCQLNYLESYFNVNKGQYLTINQNDCHRFYTTFGEIIYCWAGENLGYAKGNNLGASISKMFYKDTYYLISNNDIRLTDEFDIDTFDRIFNQFPSIAVIGPRIVGMDGIEQSPHKKISSFKRLILYYWVNRWPLKINLDYDYTDASKICYRVMGSFMVVKAEPFDDIGGFDPKTFMFAEEMILSERLEKKGYQTYFFNDYTVVHEHGISVKKNASIKKSEEWAFNSLCYYYKKYRHAPKFLLMIASLNFHLYLIRLSVRSFIKIQFKRILKMQKLDK